MYFFCLVSILRFIHIVYFNSTFLFIAKSSPINGYATTFLFIYLLIDTWVVSSLGWLQVKLLWIFMYKYWMLSFLLGKYLGVEWLVIWYRCLFNFSRNEKLFSKIVVPFYIPTNSIWVQVPPHLHKHLTQSVFLILDVPIGMWWYLIAVLLQRSTWVSTPPAQGQVVFLN